MSMFESVDSILGDSDEPSAIIPNFTTLEMSIKSFVEKLRNIDSMSNRDIQGVIYRQYDMLLDYDLFLSDPELREIAQEMFTNERFLYNLTICVQNLTLNEHQIICCNKLAYDYISYHKADDMNPTIVNLLLDLSFRVNIKEVAPLSAIIGMESAKYVAMIQKSSFNENLNITRLNRYLIRSGMEITEQDILDIYAILYSSVSNLFIVTMMTMPDDDYNRLEAFRYDEMSKVMLDILDNMTSIEMERVLRNYSSAYFLKGEPPVRFSLRDIHQSYDRILAVIDNLRDDGVEVP